MGLFSKITGGGGGGGGGGASKGAAIGFAAGGPLGAAIGSAISRGGGPQGIVQALATGGLSELRSLPGIATDIFGNKRSDQELANAAMQLDPGDRPIAPLWTNLLDPKTKQLISEYQLGGKGTPYGDILARYREQAFRAPGEKSPEQMILEQRLGEAQASQLGGIATDQARNQALARSALASKRGLSGAAAERLALGSARDASMAAQDVRAAGADKLLGIQSNELQNRQDLFNRLAGIEQDVQQKNIQGALGEVNAARQKAQEDYQNQMAAWAAGKTGQATILAGRGGKK